MDRLCIRASTRSSPTFRLIIDDLAQRLKATPYGWDDYTQSLEADIFVDGSPLAMVKIRQGPDTQFRFMYYKRFPRTCCGIDLFSLEDPNSYDPEKVAERIENWLTLGCI